MLPRSILCVYFILFLCACNEHSSQEKLLHGKWLVDNYRIHGMTKSVDTDRLQEEIQKLRPNSYFLFNKDNTYEIQLNGSLEKGKWRIDTETQKLYTHKSETNFEIPLNIDTLKPDILVFSRTKDSITTQVRLIKIKTYEK